MSAAIFPLSKARGSSFKTAARSADPAWDVYDVFNPEVTDADMKRVRDAVVPAANYGHAVRGALADLQAQSDALSKVLAIAGSSATPQWSATRDVRDALDKLISHLMKEAAT